MSALRAVLPTVVVCWLCLCVSAYDETSRLDNVYVAWEFEDGLEGFANSTTEALQAEAYAQGGEFHMEFRGENPSFDSPLFEFTLYDDAYIVLRMNYHGRGASIHFWLRDSSFPPAEYRTGDAEWRDGEYFERTVDLYNDGRYHVYYIPLFDARNPTPTQQVTITQLRFFPAVPARPGEAAIVDWIRIMKAPTIQRVEGCSYLPPESAGRGVYPEVPYRQWVRPPGPLNQYFDNAADVVLTRGPVGAEERSHNQTYAITYNCLRSGGERIRISGLHLGLAGARVLVDQRPCTNVIHEVPHRVISCVTPSAPDSGGVEALNVTVANGRLPGLRDSKQLLSYQVSTASPPRPTISNIAASSVEIAWLPPVDHFDALTVTGYWIERRLYVDGEGWGDWHDPEVTGNVSTTTMINLQPNTRYQFRVASMVEDQVASLAWRNLDMYGRRAPISGFLRGDFSTQSATVQTLEYDFNFEYFSAAQILNYGPTYAASTHGMLNTQRGEGHDGLVLKGTATIEHCNQTHSCCDGYDTSKGYFGRGADTCTLACAAVARMRPPYLNNVGQRDSETYPIPTPDPAPGMGDSHPAGAGSAATDHGSEGDLPSPPTTYPNGMFIGDPRILTRRPTHPCGPALRLTGAHGRQLGAAWYNRQMHVREGFDTTFVFRLSNPSSFCKVMNDVFTNCRSRGGDGFAFVIQNSHPAALGRGGMGLGYDGIPNSVAIEFDTWYNFEVLDRGENHISVHTRGLSPNSANHTFELAHAVESVPDLSADEITVRISYSPKFEMDSIKAYSFFGSSGHLAGFLTGGDFAEGGFGPWGSGMGTLKVFLQNQNQPVLIVPLNLDHTLDISDNDGRAWVGFTSTTGESVWQNHDILNWNFVSTREDLVRARKDMPGETAAGKSEWNPYVQEIIVYQPCLCG